MAVEFKSITLRPMTGVFDTLSSADEIGYGNFRIVKNAITRSTRNRQRGGGFRRAFADDTPYNNQDLHDQLTNLQFYYDQFSDHAMGGGVFVGYNYPYFSPSYVVDGAIVFPAASGPYCPVYLGNFPDGLYNGCPIFYPSVGYPYNFIPGFVNATGARAHWRMDTIAATTPDLFGGLNLTNFGPTVEAGIIGNALRFSGSKWLESSDANFQTGNIYFGFTGWIKRYNTGSASEPVIDKWATAGNRQYRIRIVNNKLTFEVSSDGTNTITVTATTSFPLGEMTHFACWHDPVLDTINVKINDGTKVSTAHSAGVASAATTFGMGINEETSVAGFDGSLDAITFWKNRFPSESEIVAMYNAGSGISYPFDSGACDTGAPFYYLYSFLYTSCPVMYPDSLVAGYPYGPRTPTYSPRFSYDYEYCGNYRWLRPGCREAVTMLNEIVTSGGRKLIAATMSRVYEFNRSAGNWRLLADGLGGQVYSTDQCTCNSIRGRSAAIGEFLNFTNNFDPPAQYLLSTEANTCDQNVLQPITDLDALGITRAGGVVCWKGFTIWFDLTESGTRFGGDVIWSDSEDPTAYIESDTSFAGRATIAVGATILAAAPIGNWLIFYTDKGIIRCTLVGGEDVFNFEVIYEGGNAMKFKHSLINAGDMHLYMGESDIYVFTQFDTRPINIPWITKAAGMIFNGIVEDDATYEPINRDACDLVTGGWSDEKREAWFSWPSGNNVCPDVTLRLNLKFNAADFVDHGFTAFLTFRPDDNPTIGQWIEDRGICPRGSQVAVGAKEGRVCTNSGSVVSNPPLYIRNPTENPDLPIHPSSLCAQLAGATVDDFCPDCPSPTLFITASALDFTLKQQEDDVLYRELLGGNIEAYDGYSCHGEFYHFVGYDTVIQEGAEMYKTDDEKMIKRISLEAEPWTQSSPSDLEASIGYASTPNCFTWKEITPIPFECQTEFTAAQHLANRTRPDGTFNFATWTRGIYLSARFRIRGIGGGGTFSAIHKILKGWGQAINP